MATFKDISAVEKRATDLRDWLQKTAPDCLTEQKHLDENSQERVYWHYGYMVALRDVLRLLTDSETPTRRSCSADTTNSRSAA